MSIEGFLRRYWHYLALLIVVLIALWYRTGAISNFIIPTWGNTMYHVGIERETIETGHYPRMELSYGGGFPHFYVPAYRLLVAALSIATGIDPMPMSGLIVLVLGVFGLLAVYILAYRLSGNYYVALFAAFFYILSPDITINTVRPFPELMGLFLLPLALYFIVREDWPMAMLSAIVMALTHQQSVLALVAIMGLYTVFQLVYAVAFTRQFRKTMMSLLPIAAACATYAVWQMYTIGSLNIFKIAQVAYHEQWPVTISTIMQTGTFVLVFFAIGLAYLGYTWLTSPPAQPDKALKVDQKGKPKKAVPATGTKRNVGGSRVLIGVGIVIAVFILGVLLLVFGGGYLSYGFAAGIGLVVGAAVGGIYLLYRSGPIIFQRMAKQAERGVAEEKRYSLHVSVDALLLLAAWMIATILLTKNEMWGTLTFNLIQLNTLQSRFYTYFVDAAIILAGFGMYAFLSWIDFEPLLESPE